MNAYTYAVTYFDPFGTDLHSLKPSTRLVQFEADPGPGFLSRLRAAAQRGAHRGEDFLLFEDPQDYTGCHEIRIPLAVRVAVNGVLNDGFRAAFLSGECVGPGVEQ